MYFLDTSAILEVLHGSERGLKIKNYIGENPIFISTISVHEILVGLKENEKKLVERFFREVTAIEYDKSSAIKSSEIERHLRSKGKLINIADILISGSCLVLNFTLVTCDNDFLKISNLKTKIFL